MAVAVLLRYEQLWTRRWLEPEAARLASSPGVGPVAIFDALDEWLVKPITRAAFSSTPCSRHAITPNGSSGLDADLAA